MKFLWQYSKRCKHCCRSGFWRTIYKNLYLQKPLCALNILKQYYSRAKYAKYARIYNLLLISTLDENDFYTPILSSAFKYRTASRKRLTRMTDEP